MLRLCRLRLLALGFQDFSYLLLLPCELVLLLPLFY